MKRVALIFLLATLALVACSPKAMELSPPEIAYGRDMCDACGMLIDEPQFAAAVILEDGTPRKYDDIGEMIQYHRKHPELKVKAWFVHDYDTQEWLPAETAYFVQSSQLKTPMGGGLAAFASQQRAEQFAQQVSGKVMRFEELMENAPTMSHGGG